LRSLATISVLSSWIAACSVVADEAVEELVGRRLRWWWKRLRRTEEVVVIVAVVQEGAGLDAMGLRGVGVGVEWWRMPVEVLGLRDV